MSCSAFVVLLDLMQPGYLKFAPFKEMVNEQAKQIINNNSMPVINPTIIKYNPNIIKSSVKRNPICNSAVLDAFNLECKSENHPVHQLPDLKRKSI